MHSTEEREAQDAFLEARQKYLVAKMEFNNARLSEWQRQIARDQYIEAIEKFALACGILSKRDFSLL